MTDALSATVKREGLAKVEERKLTIALSKYATRLSAASPRGAERGRTPFVSCSAFGAPDAPADEAEEFSFRVELFRVALRRFVPEGTLPEARYEWLVTAADRSWAEIIPKPTPKPEAQSILEFVRGQFALHNKDAAEALGDYIVSLQEEAQTNVALSATMNGADDAANLLIVETALCRASELDDDFLAAAQSIFRNLRSSRAPATAPAPSVALPPGTSSPKKGLMWLRGLLSHDLPLISADRSGSCASLPDLLEQCHHGNPKRFGFP